MTRDEQFLARWDSEKEAYLYWGEHLSARVVAALEEAIEPIKASYFLKAAPIPRLKDDLTLITKAFYRNKNYTDPYDDITDKVGTRFVVLLGTHVRQVAGLLEAIPGWDFSLDRDYESEQSENPITFDYAAVHYVVRPQQAFTVDNITVPAGTPCEVQIKTILQHAYSELTHDTIYKPQIQATSVMRRNAAKAMALLEATNDYFERVAVDVDEALAAVRDATSQLSSVYLAATGLTPSPNLLEGLLLEAYEPSLKPDTVDRARAMLVEKPFLVERIKAKVAARNPLFSQPSILLAYLDIVDRGGRALRSWPLTPAEMDPLLADLGETSYQDR